MPDYKVKVLCEECGEVHQAAVRIFLKDGPDKEMSVTEAYADQAVPGDVASLTTSRNMCFKSGKEFVQADIGKFYLSPVKEHPPEEDTGPSLPNGDISVSYLNFFEQLSRAVAGHKELTQDQRRFWSYTLHEMGKHPLLPKIAGGVLVSMLLKTETNANERAAAYSEGERFQRLTKMPGQENGG